MSYQYAEPRQDQSSDETVSTRPTSFSIIRKLKSYPKYTRHQLAPPMAACMAPDSAWRRGGRVLSRRIGRRCATPPDREWGLLPSASKTTTRRPPRNHTRRRWNVALGWCLGTHSSIILNERARSEDRVSPGSFVRLHTCVQSYLTRPGVVESP